MIDEVLLSKAETIERCIRRVRQTYVGHEDAFDTDLDRQDVIVLNLQRACEAAIDMANRVIKLRRLRYPKESKDSFRVLSQAGCVGKQLGDTMVAMIGFRNVAVHDYQALDLKKVRGIVEHHLDDLLEFSKAVLGTEPAD